MKLLNQAQAARNTSNPGSSSNIVGSYEPGINLNKAMLVAKILKDWIIDTKATNQMVSILDMLNKSFVIQLTNPKQVQLPDEETTHVTHTGSSLVSPENTLSNVFVLPQFKYNIMYVSRVTKELKCVVSFYPDFCVL